VRVYTCHKSPLSYGGTESDTYLKVTLVVLKEPREGTFGVWDIWHQQILHPKTDSETWSQNWGHIGDTQSCEGSGWMRRKIGDPTLGRCLHFRYRCHPGLARNPACVIPKMSPWECDIPVLRSRPLRASGWGRVWIWGLQRGDSSLRT
jgi:hypothetical protein